MGIDTKSQAHSRRQIGPPVEWGEVISGGAWQVADKYQGFEVFVALRDVGYVVLSRFPLVHRMGVQVRFVVLTGGLEGLSESTFETVELWLLSGQRRKRCGASDVPLWTDLQ